MKKYYLFLIGALLQTTLFAQQKDTISVKEIDLDEFVFSANRVKEMKKQVAQTITTISEKEIKLSNAQNAADLLQQQANIYVQKSQQGGGSPVLRGFEANKVLIEVDGIRLNNLIYRAGHLQNIISLDNNSIERVEVLYGPSSTIYGSDALGGVIHFYTKKPVLSSTTNLYQKTNAYFRYGSVNNELTGHLDVNLGGKKLASFSSFTFSKFNDLLMGRSKNLLNKENLWERPTYVDRINGIDTVMQNKNKYLQKQSDYWQYNIVQNFLIQQNEKISHRINLQFTTSSNVPRYDRLTDVKNGNLRYAEWYYGPQQMVLAAYIFNAKSTFFDDITWTTSYQNVKESRHNRSFGSTNRSDRMENVNVAATTLNILKVIKSHSTRFGVDAQLNWLKSTANVTNINTGATSPLDTRYPDGKDAMYNVAAFVSHNWHITKKLILSDGLRLGYSYTRANIVDNSFFNLPVTSFNNHNFVYSGNVGLIYNYKANDKVFANFSTGYRVPNMDDLSKIFETAPGMVIIPNNHLKAEKSLNAELGFATTLFKHIKWDVSGYYTAIIDAVSLSTAQLNGLDSIVYDGTMSKIFTNKNNQRAYIAGVSTSLKIPFAKFFTFSTMLNYTYGRIKNKGGDIPLDHISPLFLQSKLSFDYKKLNTAIAFNFQDAKRLKDYNPSGEDNLAYATTNGTAAWFTLDFNISYQIYKYITLQFGINNILDTQYRVFASGINAPGRNLYGTVRFHF